VGVFARSKKKEETQREHGGDGVAERVSQLALKIACMTDEYQRDGLDAGGWRVGFVVYRQEAAQAEV